MQKVWPVSKYHNGIIIANSGRIWIVGRAQSSQTADYFKGVASNIFCTLIFVLGESFDQKFLLWHCIYFTIVGFIAEILLDLDRLHQRDIVA